MSNEQSNAAAAIKVAVIGFGLAGRVFHAPFVSAVPGLQLTSIVQRKGDEAAKAYPEVAILRSFEAALASDAELIVIGTPNETHYALAKQALEAGKHVVVDKPFAATSEQARTLVELAAARKLVLAPFQNRRWDGDFLTVRDVLEHEELGRLVTFESHFDRFRPLPRPNTWKESGSACNGLLFDLAPHLLDQALALFGAPEAITASVRKDRDTSDIEDAFDIVLHYPGLLAICRSTHAGLATPRRASCCTAPRGSFKKYGLDPQEPALVAGGHVPRLNEAPDAEPDHWLTEQESHWGLLTVAPDPAEPGILVTRKIETRPGDYRRFYANVRDAIRGVAPLAVTPGGRLSHHSTAGACPRKQRQPTHASGRVLGRLSGLWRRRRGYRLRYPRLTSLVQWKTMNTVTNESPAALPLGFEWGAVKAGIKASGNLDLAVASRSQRSQCRSDVHHQPARRRSGHRRADDTWQPPAAASRRCWSTPATPTAPPAPPASRPAWRPAPPLPRAFSCSSDEVFPSSTGIIGVPFPAEKVVAALPAVKASLGSTAEHAELFARAIMTTDTKMKISSAVIDVDGAGRQIRIFGAAKGAGMIHPQLGPAARDHAGLSLHRRSSPTRPSSRPCCTRRSSAASTASPSTATPRPTTPCC